VKYWKYHLWLAGASQAGGRRLLRSLAIHNLIDRSTDPTDRSGEHGSHSRDHPHDLPRDYARSRANTDEPAAERQAALNRLTAHYRAMTHDVKRYHDQPEVPPPGSVGLVFRDLAHANAWLITERANLLACLDTSPTTARPGTSVARRTSCGGWPRWTGC
jgi:hypothetical protein